MEIKLFGSAARGDLNENSDIDILIVLKYYDISLRKKLISIATDLTLVADRYLSVKVLESKQYQEFLHLATPFIRNVEQEGISLWTMH